MGIRFYCPDCGRRLNIKTFLAGKRGICPHCDARVRIPLESQIPADAPKYRPASEGNGSTARRVTESASAATSFAEEEDDMALVTEKVESPPADPIDEAPDAVWYVRPPSGGQYGPARGEVMRRWLSEGRVSADSMVWREGWSDWQTAGPLFPSLQPAHTATAVVPQTAFAPAPSLLAGDQAVVAAESRAQTTTASKRTGTKRNKSLVPVIILGLLIVVLLVVTVIVLTRT